MENIIKCANCGKEILDGRHIFHELKLACISWYNCYECEEDLSTHGDKPFVAPKEEMPIALGIAGPGKMRNAKEVLQDLIEKARKDDNLLVIDLKNNSLNDFIVDSKEEEEQVREFNEVISYFKESMKRHNIIAKIISDNVDHKYFMDELNNHTYGKGSSCTIVLDNRIWICTSNDDIVKLVLIDDRTTKKDLTTEVKARIFEVFQESEIATMKKKHKKELDLLKGTYESGPAPQAPNNNRMRR